MITACPETKGRVLLLFPPTQCNLGSLSSHRSGPSLNQLVPPLGLLYIASSLRPKGYDVKIIDFTVESINKRKFKEIINNQDVIGISVLGENRNFAFQIVDAIRRINSKVFIILGGPDITMTPEFPDGADVIVLGEAENVIAEVIKRLLEKESLQECEGIIFRNRSTGQIMQTGSTLTTKNLDQIEFPARDLINPGSYNAFNPFFKGKWASIATSRGCPFNCNFCAWPSPQHKVYRSRSADNVLDEMQEIYKNGFQFLYVVDSNFLVDRDRTIKIADGILERNIDLRMTILGRADSADESLYHKLKKAGVRIIGFGLESGNQAILDFYKKGTTVEQNRLAITLADKKGLYTHGDFMIGSPIETPSDIEQTILFAKSIPLDTVLFNIFTLRKGSLLWKQAFEKGLISANEDNVPLTRDRGLGNFTKDELIAFQKRAYKEFYVRPNYWARQIRKAFRLSDSRFTLLALAAGWAIIKQKLWHRKDNPIFY